MLLPFPGSQTSASLRELFSEAVFIGSENIVTSHCSCQPNHCNEGSVLAIGLDDEMIENDCIQAALAQGIGGILTDRLLPFSTPQCLVPDVRSAYAKLTHALAGRPCEDLLTVGVMGTHGKTTTSLLIAAMLKRLGGRVAYRTSIGTSNGKDNHVRLSQDPMACELARWLKDACENQCPAAVIEHSDRMLIQRTTSGLEYDVIVMPGLRSSQRLSSLEMRGLETAILRAFDQLKNHGIVIYNADDARLNQWVQKSKIPAIGYGLDADAEVRGKRMDREIGFQSMMVSAGNCLMPLNTPLIGDHQARHLLAAVATGYAFGLELHEVIGGVERMTKIPGRMQPIQCGQEFSVYVDQADQADRLAVALHAMARHNPAPITCVAEVPETSDAEARAAFGRVLERSASRVILTQSRTTCQSGQSSMWEVLDGCERPAAVQLVPNRAAAIELALRSSRASDQVLLAGWGSNSWTSGNSREVQSDFDYASTILRQLNDGSLPQPANIQALRTDD